MFLFLVPMFSSSPTRAKPQNGMGDGRLGIRNWELRTGPAIAGHVGAEFIYLFNRFFSASRYPIFLFCIIYFLSFSMFLLSKKKLYSCPNIIIFA